MNKRESIKQAGEWLKAKAAAEKRIGVNDKELFQWAVRSAYDQPRTPGGFAEFEGDVYWFCVLAGALPLGPAAGAEVREPGNVGKRLLRKFRDIIGKSVARERIPLARESRSLRWFPERENRAGSYVLWTDSQDDFDSIAIGALSRLILEFGGLIRKCPAPAIRAKHGEQCGRWFVARRENQDYCNTTCLSRKTSRDNPPKKKPKRKRKAH